MLPVWRIAPRITRVVSSGLYSGLAPVDAAYGGITSVEGVQGTPNTDKMTVSAARRVMLAAAEYQRHGPSVQGIQEGYGRLIGPTGSRLMNKYLSFKKQTIPVRHFSSATRLFGSQQGAQAYVYEDMGKEDDVCPQGIQGDECVQFKLWLENCQRYHLPNCDEQAHAIETGRKTLAEVFQEQQEIIREVADKYKKKQTELGAHDQGIQDSPYVCDFDLSAPCPQGLQGSDCDNFKLWMYNCHQFGFGDCKERLNEVRAGRLNISDIFEEQDELIRQVVRDYQQRRSYSTDSRSQHEVGNSQSNSIPSTPPPSNPASETVEILSQKEKLKRAVKDYGGTVIVFHVGISLMSLGGFYVAVTRYGFLVLVYIWDYSQNDN